MANMERQLDAMGDGDQEEDGEMVRGWRMKRTFKKRSKKSERT